ncbi:MAG: hypothetical protein K1X39_12200 [Thermoflexales bacterium]|nr:hypothetical protein [Thermoflexales bacterium]
MDAELSDRVIEAAQRHLRLAMRRDDPHTRLGHQTTQRAIAAVNRWRAALAHARRTELEARQALRELDLWNQRMAHLRERDQEETT